MGGTGRTTDLFSITLLGADGYYDTDYPHISLEYELPHEGVRLPLFIDVMGGCYERDDKWRPREPFTMPSCSEVTYRRVG